MKNFIGVSFGIGCIVFIAWFLFHVFFYMDYKKSILFGHGTFTKGVITGSCHTEAPATCYSFWAKNGVEYFGGYRSGAIPGYKGDTINVVYLADNPEINGIPEEINAPYIRWIYNTFRK